MPCGCPFGTRNTDEEYGLNEFSIIPAPNNFVVCVSISLISERFNLKCLKLTDVSSYNFISIGSVSIHLDST